MTISLKKENLAGQSYFHTCAGTIAFDTAGSSYHSLLNSKVKEHIRDGYSVIGFRFSTKILHEFESDSMTNVDIVLVKNDQHFCVTREINFFELIKSLTWLSVQIADSGLFEADSINWGELISI